MEKEWMEIQFSKLTIVIESNIYKNSVKYQNMVWKYYQAMCSRYDRYKYINGVQIENSIDYVIIKWGTQQVINNNE